MLLSAAAWPAEPLRAPPDDWFDGGVTFKVKEATNALVRSLTYGALAVPTTPALDDSLPFVALLRLEPHQVRVRDRHIAVSGVLRLTSIPGAGAMRL